MGHLQVLASACTSSLLSTCFSHCLFHPAPGGSPQEVPTPSLDIHLCPLKPRCTYQPCDPPEDRPEEGALPPRKQLQTGDQESWNPEQALEGSNQAPREVSPELEEGHSRGLDGWASGPRPASGAGHGPRSSMTATIFLC